MKKDIELLKLSYNTWMQWADFRASRLRHKRYTFGDQWFETVADGNGRGKSERQLLLESGRRPLTNNLLRRMVKTMVGIYRNRAASAEVYDDTPGSFDSRNRLSELDARMFEEFVISGCAVQRVAPENRGGSTQMWVDNVDPRRFFVSRFSDPRGLDIDCVGMLHDMTLAQLINRFGRGSRNAVAELHQLAADCRQDDFYADDILGTGVDSEFSHPENPDRMRVVEIWRLEGRPATVRGRIRMDMQWRCSWLAPDGTVLDTYPSDLTHRTHPFVVKMYPLIDGEVHSFIEDVIDQQRNVNRLLVLADTILAHSAKNPVLYPLDQLPRGMELREVAESWALPGAVIPIAGRTGVLPQVAQSGTATTQAGEMLDLHMRLFDKTSGVNDALLGQNVSAATGANLYDAQVRNSMTMLIDLLETFDSFRAQRSSIK